MRAFSRTILRALPLVGVMALAAMPVVAQHSGHQNHGKAATAASDNAAVRAFKAANDRMHKDMGIAFSGNADVDFIKGMIPHHQGAIDMAKVVLAHGKDAETRKLATEIIAAQEKEIAFMRAWLKSKGH